MRVFSPYQFNPLNFNPLRHILEQSVDFERLRASPQIKLFLSATNVRSGKVRIFKTEEVTPDAVLASACLPFLFQAVEIDGEAYWDGGYMGNPAIYPLIYECALVRRGGGAHQSAGAPGGAQDGDRDPQPRQRDLLQLLADARDAGDRLRHPPDRRGPGQARQP